MKVCPPFDYTVQLVIGVKVFEEEIEKEFRRVVHMPRLCGGAEKRYKDEPGALELNEGGVPKWKAKATSIINGRSKDAKRCVTDLMDYTVTEMKNLYEGTVMEDKWMVYGDALSTWHESEAQAYLKETYPGMESRFITPVGSSRVGVTARHLGPPGNSPENCSLDCHLFSDLESGMSLNLSLASVFPVGDPRRIFSQETPKEVFKLMKETWEHCAPASERMEEDMLNWPRVL